MSTITKRDLFRVGIGAAILVPLLALAVVSPIIIIGAMLLGVLIFLAWTLGSLLLGDWREDENLDQ